MRAADALLAAQTLEALEKGTMLKTTEFVKARLLAKAELTDDDGLKPFVELTLMAIKEIALRSGTLDDKHNRIMDMLVLGGF